MIDKVKKFIEKRNKWKGKKAMSTSVVMLAYKEAENLEHLLPRVYKAMEELKEPYEILIIDSATPLDHTEEVCKRYGAVYIPQEEPHYAGAFRTGIKHARYEKFQVLDADGSHTPETIPEIHRLFAQGYDMVIGSRYTKGGKTHDYVTSIIMSKILNTVMRICIGVKAKDISTAFRLYKTEMLKAVILKSQNYDVLQEVILRMKLLKMERGEGTFCIGEVPITFEKRVYGESKRKLVTFIIGYIKTLWSLIGIRISHSLKRK